MLGENGESLKDLLETFYEDVTFDVFEAAFKGEGEPADAEGMSQRRLPCNSEPFSFHREI